MHQSEHDIDEFDEELKSKTEIKREMHDMQDFAFKIINMSKHQRSRLPLTDELKDAMILADKIKTKHEALKRHTRYVAKVLLETDLEPIRHAIDVMANKHQQETAKHTRLEEMRDRVISEGNNFVEELISEYGTIERQKIRQLMRQAAKEVKAEKPAKYFKELFAYLKEHCQ